MFTGECFNILQGVFINYGEFALVTWQRLWVTVEERKSSISQYLSGKKILNVVLLPVLSNQSNIVSESGRVIKSWEMPSKFVNYEAFSNVVKSFGPCTLTLI